MSKSTKAKKVSKADALRAKQLKIVQAKMRAKKNLPPLVDPIQAIADNLVIDLEAEASVEEVVDDNVTNPILVEPGKRENQHKFFVGTLNNYTTIELDQIAAIVPQKADVSFIVYGKEIAPKTKTKHLQMYVETFKKGISSF